jgi:hypothetical protein
MATLGQPGVPGWPVPLTVGVGPSAVPAPVPAAPVSVPAAPVSAPDVSNAPSPAVAAAARGGEEETPNSIQSQAIVTPALPTVVETPTAPQALPPAVAPVPTTFVAPPVKTATPTPPRSTLAMPGPALYHSPPAAISLPPAHQSLAALDSHYRHLDLARSSSTPVATPLVPTLSACPLAPTLCREMTFAAPHARFDSWL